MTIASKSQREYIDLYLQFVLKQNMIIIRYCLKIDLMILL